MSVSIPTPIDNPIREITFIVTPKRDKKANVNIIAIGNANDISIVALIFFKNTKSTIVARTSPVIAFPFTPEIDELIFSE